MTDTAVTKNTVLFLWIYSACSILNMHHKNTDYKGSLKWESTSLFWCKFALHPLFLVVQVQYYCLARVVTREVCGECLGWWDWSFPRKLQPESWCSVFTNWASALQRILWIHFLSYHCEWVGFCHTYQICGALPLKAASLPINYWQTIWFVDNLLLVIC